MTRTLILAGLLAGVSWGPAAASVVVDGTQISIPDGMEPVPGTLDDETRAGGLQRALNRAFVRVHGHAEGLALFADPRDPGNSLVIGRVPTAEADWPVGSTDVIVPVQATAGSDRRVYLVMTRSHIVPTAAVECGYRAFAVEGARPLPKGHARCVVTGRFTGSLGFGICEKIA